jgi:chromosome segregation ATPase
MRKTVAQALDGLERHLIEGFDRVARRFDEVDTRIAALHSEVEGLRSEMYGQFDAVYQRLDRLETEYQMFVAGIRRIEAQMAEDRNDRSQLHAQVSDLRERVKELEERLRELEAKLDDEPREPPPSKPS